VSVGRGGAGIEDKVARAVWAYNIAIEDAEPNKRMAERAFAPVAGDRAFGGMNDLGHDGRLWRDAELWDVGHAFLGGFSIARMIASRAMLSINVLV
jgi:hypothetical protein